MPYYIQFTDETGNTILVEASAEEMAGSGPGVVKAGIGERINETIARAQDTFENALERIIKSNAESFFHAIQKLSNAPTQVEISFGLKVTGEASNFAIGKLGGDANFSVKLSWKTESKG